MKYMPDIKPGTTYTEKIYSISSCLKVRLTLSYIAGERPSVLVK